MNYSENFKQAIELGTYLGTGNPNSKILVIGKEVATDVEEGIDKKLETQNLVSFNNNCNDWKKNINEQISQENIPNWNGNENNPLYAFKGVKIKKEGHTWRKYQKLNNLIFDKKNNNEINFQEEFFITEMSILPSKTTSKAQKMSNFKDELKKRKESFFNSDYIQDFPIIILACGNYISGEEITKIFKVKFIEEKGSERQKFWIHWNDEKTKLVIHTRQLSANVSNELLLGIANEIKKILNK
tara:strand:- start:582 stop:1307 length:726 start_codon:yes stop_codon:yes gene_type:complete